MTWNSFLKSKLASWTLVTVLILIGFLSGRMYLQKRKIDLEIKKLQSQAEEIRKENENLSGLINYWGTPEYQEKEAREKLNLKKEGEFVVVLPDGAKSSATQSSAPEEEPNLNKWFDYFFNAKN